MVSANNTLTGRSRLSQISYNLTKSRNSFFFSLLKRSSLTSNGILSARSVPVVRWPIWKSSALRFLRMKNLPDWTRYSWCQHRDHRSMPHHFGVRELLRPSQRSRSTLSPHLNDKGGNAKQ